MRHLFDSWFDHIRVLFLIASVIIIRVTVNMAQELPKEDNYFKIVSIPSPQQALLEVGGLTVMPDGNLGLSTRRGDIYIVENPTSNQPFFRKFASGLHEVLGLTYKGGAFYCAQRGELTKLMDTNMDGKADVFETIYSWPLTGNYHEYSYGPHLSPDGSFFVTTNLGFFNGEWWRGKSLVPWRGWALKIYENGNMVPWATGMRSPCGLGIIDGELFYTDNQGDWIGSGGLWHVNKGDFMGNPAGLNWTGNAASPLKLSVDELHAQVDPQRSQDAKGNYIRPENSVNGKFVTLADVQQKIPSLRLPAVWLPYGFLGISTSEPIKVPEGTFGPFAGQVLVGDQGMSIISRVFLEKINGEYQGASFLFRSGFNSGVVRLAWAHDGSLFVGETRRGWGSSGNANEGLERLVWTSEIPFEMKAVRAMPDGFEIEFTKALDTQSASDLSSYAVERFTYKYQPVYGSPPVNSEKCIVRGIKLSEDGMKARIIVDNLRKTYIHKITLAGILDRHLTHPLLHSTAYYTLNNIPDGIKLSMNDVSIKVNSENQPGMIKPVTKDISSKKMITAGKPTSNAVNSNPSKPPVFFDVKGLLVNYTCPSCHTIGAKLVGPGYIDIAKRNYSNEKIVELIHNPQPQNWPGYETAMPPMPQVTRDDALKIANWINSLDD